MNIVSRIVRYSKLLFQKMLTLFNRRVSFFAILDSVTIDKTASVQANSRLHNVVLGRYSYIAKNTLVQRTTIGKFCSISDGCNIGLPSHPMTFLSTSPVFLKGNNRLNVHLGQLEYISCEETQIGNDVWIGANVLVKSGVTIGDGAIIGAGAVVTKDVAPYSVMAGIPAREIKKRFDDETIKSLTKMKWWDWDNKKLMKYSDLMNRPCELIRSVAEDKD